MGRWWDDPRGTTSACAENTADAEVADAIKRNYLRVRGEYTFAGAVDINNLELPPRARRIHQTPDWVPPDAGTTSACAENTRCR